MPAQPSGFSSSFFPNAILGKDPRSLSDLSNPANSFYHLDQIALTSLRVFQDTQVSHHDLLSNSKTFYSNRPKSDKLLAVIKKPTLFGGSVSRQSKVSCYLRRRNPRVRPSSPRRTLDGSGMIEMAEAPPARAPTSAELREVFQMAISSIRPP
jgi:hypothetical protein